MKILIVGGTGETGQWFTRFFRGLGYNVVVWGAHGREDIAKAMGVPYAQDLDGEIKTSDIVLISVPINRTEEVIRDIAPKMRQSSLLMDVTSIKVGPVEAMKKYAPPGVEILGTHPMFGPTIPNLHGQIVILVPTEGRCSSWFPKIKALYEENGAHVETMDAAQHDRMMAVVQGLTHFAYISIGAAFRGLDFNVNESRRFMSPVYEIMVDFIGRILAQNPYLYAMIQMNPEVARVHEKYLQECIELSGMVRKGDIEGFVREMKKAASHFGDTASALRRSDKLINSKIAEFEELVHSIGRERGLRHIYSGVTHIGVIKKVTPRTVLLEGQGRDTELKIENIALLSDKELLEWKKENLKHVTRDVSVIIPEGADPETINQVLATSEGVVSSNILDVYRMGGNISVTFHVTIFKEKVKEVQEALEKLLQGIGCKLR